MTEPPDGLARDAVRSRLALREEELAFYDALPSTQTRARELASSSPVRLVLARRQTAGVGREGRPWVSDQGGGALTFTVILRARVPAEHVSVLALAAGVAVREALELQGVPTALKWPNDVLRAGLKIAGILCEAEIRDGRLEWALAGIGINLAGDLDDSLREIATTAHTGVDPLEVLAQIFARLHERCDEIGLGRVRDVLDAWSRHSATLGNNVRFTSAGRTIEGIAEFIDPHGALVIRAADGRRHTCIAGQLRHLG